MSTGTYRTLLRSWGFQSFLWTQFLGAFNDNVYKIGGIIYRTTGLHGSAGLPTLRTWRDTLPITPPRFDSSTRTPAWSPSKTR